MNGYHVKRVGEKIPPKGTRYCPLIHIYNADKHNEWSIDFICPDFNKTNIITFCFLVNEAPTDLIELNAIYDVCEGTKIVAKILIFEI